MTGSAAPAGASPSSGSAAAHLMIGFWRLPMPRLASLFLPDLAIDRIRRAERTAAPPARVPAPRAAGHVLPARGGGWRPGARWARAEAPQSFTLRHAEGALVTARREANRMVVAAACPQARAL